MTYSCQSGGSHSPAWFAAAASRDVVQRTGYLGDRAAGSGAGKLLGGIILESGRE